MNYSGTGTVYISGEPQFTPWIHIALYLVFCVVFCSQNQKSQKVLFKVGTFLTAQYKLSRAVDHW